MRIDEAGGENLEVSVHPDTGERIVVVKSTKIETGSFIFNLCVEDLGGGMERLTLKINGKTFFLYADDQNPLLCPVRHLYKSLLDCQSLYLRYVSIFI